MLCYTIEGWLAPTSISTIGRGGEHPQGGCQNSLFRGWDHIILYMVGKLFPNSTHFKRKLVKYVPWSGCYRAVPSQNGDKFVTSPLPQSLNDSNASEKRRMGQRRVGVQAMKEASLNTAWDTSIAENLWNVTEGAHEWNGSLRVKTRLKDHRTARPQILKKQAFLLAGLNPARRSTRPV